MQKIPPKKTSNAGGSLFGQLSLRTKLIIVAVGITMLSVAALSLYNYQNTRSQQTQSVSNNLRSIAQVQAANMGELFARQIDLLQTLGASSAIQGLVQSCDTSHCGDPAVVNLNELEANWQAANAANIDNTLVQTVLNSSASGDLSDFRESFPDNVEVIITDQYGLTLAASDRTSHYSYLK